MNIHSKLQLLDFMVIGAYIVLLTLIGIYVSYRRRNEDDQFLGGRSFGWFNVGLSIFGTNVNPSFMIASASAAYSVGMVVANFEWMAWPFLMLLGMIFAPHYLNTKISTMPQFIRKRFGRRAAEFLSWYALLSTAVLWLGGALYTGGLILSQIMDWPLWVSVSSLMALATFLTVAGGLAVVMVTDTYQAILMIAGAVILTIIGFVEVGGLGPLMEAVPPERWALIRPASDAAYPWHAMLLGYPVLGVWFWCTDQTVVQRVLGARNLRQGQVGTLFTGFLKIITPFIFILPGFFCYVLHPQLEDPNMAFMTMVGNYMPVGMLGLIIAVLIAALISTIDSGLNSFSTIFTLDIYHRKINPQASPKRIKLIGRVVTVITAVAAVGIAVSMQSVGKNLFDLIQGIIAYFAPPMAAVFLVGILWKRATSKSALWALVGGSFVSLSVGVLDLYKKPIEENFGFTIQLPHFLLMAFYLFLGIAALMIIVSLFTKNSQDEEPLPSPTETYRTAKSKVNDIWLGWAVLAMIMIAIYIIFN